MTSSDLDRTHIAVIRPLATDAAFNVKTFLPAYSTGPEAASDIDVAIPAA